MRCARSLIFVVVLGLAAQGTASASSFSSDPAPVCPGDFVLSEFIATAAEIVPEPSFHHEYDTRAGSVEFNYNGGWGMNGGDTEAPYSAGIITLRNGLGAVLEQWQINGYWPPSSVDEEGCLSWENPDVGTGYQCWLSDPEDLVDGVLTAAVPTLASSSLQGFDELGSRVEIFGETSIDYSSPDAPLDNSHERLTVTWYAPKGLDTAQALLRLRYDYDADAELSNNPMVVLMDRTDPSAPYFSPVVTIEEQTETTLTISLNVEEALVFVCGGWEEPEDDCQMTSGEVRFQKKKLHWTVTNDGDEPQTISALDLAWPERNGRLESIKRDGEMIYKQRLEPGAWLVDDGWRGCDAARTLAPGESATLTFQFKKNASQDLDDYAFTALTEADCAVTMGEPSPEPPPAMGTEVCADGVRPRALGLRYTAEGCEATNNAQDPEKASCAGNGPLPAAVRVIASSRADLSHHRTQIFFDGPVELGELFVVDAERAGESRLAPNLWLTFLDANGDTLQTLSLHTSCSQPLLLGDQFGSVILESFTPNGAAL